MTTNPSHAKTAPHNIDRRVQSAAQSDLLLLTVEMLRPPAAIETTLPSTDVSPWFDTPISTLRDVLAQAVGKREPVDQRGSALPADQGGLAELSAALTEVVALAGELDRDLWSDEYWRLFDSSQACAWTQASYIRRDKGAIIGDLCGFYNAFGWQPNMSRGERPDSLSCQLEFAGILCAMAAVAPSAAKRRIVEQALAEFARLHMHDWIHAFCCQLIDTTRLAYFGAVGQWLHLFWSRLSEHNTWPIDPVVAAPLGPTMDSGDPYECGAPDLVPLQLRDIGLQTPMHAADAGK